MITVFSHLRSITDSFVDPSSLSAYDTVVNDAVNSSSALVPLKAVYFSLYTNSCSYSNQSVKFLKFTHDTTLISLISGGDQSVKTVAMMVDRGWWGWFQPYLPRGY